MLRLAVKDVSWFMNKSNVESKNFQCQVLSWLWFWKTARLENLSKYSLVQFDNKLMKMCTGPEKYLRNA